MSAIDETTGEVVSAELVPLEQAAPVTLFGTGDPRLALKRMADIATVLNDVITQKKLYKVIKGKRYIYVEGWTTLGGMLGIVPVVTGTRPNEVGDGFIAHVEARTLDGRVVGAAEGECSKAEEKWADREPYAIRSMAQTRGISRALRAPLGQVVVLAGYEAIAEEEIDERSAPAEERREERSESTGKIPQEVQPTEQQAERLRDLVLALEELDPATDWRAEARQMAGVSSDMLTRAGADVLIHRLEEVATARLAVRD